MELVQQFLDHPQAELIMLVVGSLFTIIGLVQVVRKGFALIIWLVLFAAGLFPLMYVFKGSDIDFLADASNRVGRIAPGVADDVIKIWCDKLDEAGMR